LRNTRVVDLVNELAEYAVFTQVHDPLVDPDEAVAEYGIKVVEAENMAPAHAVVLAVPHTQFVERGWEGVTNYLIGGAGVVLDVKAVLPRDSRPEDVSLWRL
jgi:UDP-N-acetyl-D-galactosamine dehydrogenase